jgi:hypothetical protein
MSKYKIVSIRRLKARALQGKVIYYLDCCNNDKLMKWILLNLRYSVGNDGWIK